MKISFQCDYCRSSVSAETLEHFSKAGAKVRCNHFFHNGFVQSRYYVDNILRHTCMTKIGVDREQDDWYNL